MKPFFIIALCFFFCGCGDLKNSPDAIAYRESHKFTEGEIVCHKSGGPKGTIKKIYNDGEISVRFFMPDQPNNGITIGIGGNGLIAGDKGIASSNPFDETSKPFPLYIFMWHELNHEKMCN